ncbi:N-carbamoylputrescine amidase / Aliphatic amidase AmiE [Streptomyces misionensis JCM 4497]
MGPRRHDTVARRPSADVTRCPSNRARPLPRLTGHPPNGGFDEPSDPSRPLPGRLDRRQGIHDPGARAGRPRRGRPGRPSPLLPGAVLRPLLLPGAGQGVLRLRRADPRRPDRAALPVPRPSPRHRAHPADVRGGAAGCPLQHRRRDRRGRHVPRQVPQDPHPPGARVLGEVLLPPGQQRLARLRHRRRPDRRLHLLRPPLPRGLAGPRPRRRRDRLQPLGHLPGPVPLPVAAGAARGGRRQRVLRRRHQPGRRGGPRRQRLLRHHVLRGPRGPVRGRGRERQGERTRRTRPGPRQTPRGPRPLAVLPGPGPGRVHAADRAVTEAE